MVEIDEARREAHDESGGEEAAGRGERQLARGSLPPTSLLLLLLLLLLLVGLLRCLCFFLLVPTPPPSFSLLLLLLLLVLVQRDGCHCGPRTTSCSPQRPQQQQQQQRQRAGSEGATRTKSDELCVIFGVRGERDTRVAQWRAWARP